MKWVYRNNLLTSNIFFIFLHLFFPSTFPLYFPSRFLSHFPGTKRSIEVKACLDNILYGVEINMMKTLKQVSKRATSNVLLPYQGKNDTRFRWWTCVRTFSSARNSFDACMSIFLIAAFYIHIRRKESAIQLPMYTGLQKGHKFTYLIKDYGLLLTFQDINLVNWIKNRKST